MHCESASQKLPQVKPDLDMVCLQNGGVENGSVVFCNHDAGQTDRAEPREPAGLNIDRSAAELLEFYFGRRRDNEKADRIKNRHHKKQPNQNSLDIQQESMPGQVPTQKSDFQALYHDEISVLSLQSSGFSLESLGVRTISALYRQCRGGSRRLQNGSYRPPHTHALWPRRWYHPMPLRPAHDRRW